MEIFLIVIGILVLIRFIRTYNFIKKVSKLCSSYDWGFINDNNDELLLELYKDEYYIDCEWSAYNFLYLSGPNPITIFFSLKSLKISNIYSKETLDKIRNYENI